MSSHHFEQTLTSPHCIHDLLALLYRRTITCRIISWMKVHDACMGHRHDKVMLILLPIGNIFSSHQF